MSLFQNKSDYFLKGDDHLDVFHLRPHGCDVMFSHYEANTTAQDACNSTHCKCLLIQGKLALELDGKVKEVQTGEWFEIPAQAEHQINYLSDCSVIEFWFSSES